MPDDTTPTPYTPTTDEVETHFHEWAAYLEKTEPGTYPFRTWQEAMHGFRRWLTAHDQDRDRLAKIVDEVRALADGDGLCVDAKTLRAILSGGRK